MDDITVALVHDALARLYDYPHLLQHPLADRLGIGPGASQKERMRLLRGTLIGAIEQLRPQDDAPLRSPQSRSYQVLNLHYVESLLVDEVARELAVSSRQVYRDLRKAEEDLAVILGLEAPGSSAKMSSEPGSSKASHLCDEAAYLAASSGNRALIEILAEVQEAVQALALSRGVRLTSSLSNIPRERCCPSGEVVRQALISLVSLAVKLAMPGSAVALRAQSTGRVAQIIVRFESASPVHQKQLETTMRLLALVRGSLDASEGEEQDLFVVTLPSACKVCVLLVDDNADLSEMFARFLKDTPYTLVTASDAEEGLARASAGGIDVILLDVMMPGKDGWSLLQRLTNEAATRDLPVIVCSVIHDPELAASLGAAASLAKPVSRSSLLTLLDKLVAQRLQGV